MLKCCSEIAKGGSFCHEESVHIHTSLGSVSAKDRLKELSLSENASFINDSQFASGFEQGKIYDIFGLERLHNLHLGIS